MALIDKLTAIADEIRELSGTTNAMGLDAMAGNVSEANEEVSNQVDLIAQITSALEGKTSGRSYDTCTVNIGTNHGGTISRVAFVTINNSGNIEAKLNTDSSTSFNLTCLCGSLVVVCFQEGGILSYNTEKATNLGWIGSP